MAIPKGRELASCPPSCGGPLTTYRRDPMSVTTPAYDHKQWERLAGTVRKYTHHKTAGRSDDGALPSVVAHVLTPNTHGRNHEPEAT